MNAYVSTCGNLASFSVAGDIYEIAAACLMKFLLLGPMCSKLFISREVCYLKHHMKYCYYTVKKTTCNAHQIWCATLVPSGTPYMA